MSACCQNTNTNYIAACPVSCTNATVSCSNALSVVVQAILDLNQTGGSTLAAIQTQSAVICSGIDPAAVASAITTGAKNGVLFRKVTSGVEPTFMINSNMVAMKPANAQYMRWPCQQNNFFVPK